MEALGHAIRSFAVVKVAESPRLTILADETGDEAHRTQLCTLYKIVLMDSYEATVVYAGLDHLLRGTAKMIYGSIKHRAEHCDGIDLVKKWAFSCYDTCTTMFGCEGGTATLQVIDFPRSIANKCLNHKKQLALKHALQSEQFMVKHYLPNMKCAGNVTKASDKRHVMRDEVSELMGFKERIAALKPPVCTRWDTWWKAARALGETPKIYAAQCKTLIRAGQGGNQDDFLLDAGAGDPTCLGLANQFMRPEHAAVTTAMLDYMPYLTQQGKLLEAESLSYEESRQVIQNICDYTKKLSDDFKGRAPRGSKWRAFVKEVESHGVKFKRTPGRDDAWIDRLLQRLADAIHEQHVRHLEDVEELAAECRLFDFVGAPEVLATSAELKAHYDPVLEVIFKQYCDGDGPSLDRDALEREFYAFIPIYLSDARQHNAKALKGLQDAERDRVSKHNTLVREHNAMPANDTTQLALIELVLPQRLTVVQMLQHALGSPVVIADRFTSVRWLMYNHIVAARSQARVEATFSKLKKIVTRFRMLLSQEHTDMLLYICCNGPNSPFGRAAK